MQDADLLVLGITGLELASYTTTLVHRTFKFLMCALRRNPSYSFHLWSLLSDALGLSHGDHLDFPTQGNGKRLLTAFGTQP